MRLAIQLLLGLIGLLLIINSIFLLIRTNFNIGTVLPALLGTPLILAALLFDRLADGQGLWALLRYTLIGGYAAALAILIFIGLQMAGELRKEPNPQASAIVVLGAAVRGDQVSATLAARLNTAYDYWLDHQEMLFIVCGGQGPDEDISEAKAMAAYLKQRGVPEEKILKEDLSTNTRENLRFARDHLLTYLGQDDTENVKPEIVVVTSNYHVMRAVDTAQATGFAATGLGAPTLWFLLPGDFMRESLAIVYFSIFGS